MNPVTSTTRLNNVFKGSLGITEISSSPISTVTSSLETSLTHSSSGRRVVLPTALSFLLPSPSFTLHTDPYSSCSNGSLLLVCSSATSVSVLSLSSMSEARVSQEMSLSVLECWEGVALCVFLIHFYKRPDNEGL